VANGTGTSGQVLIFARPEDPVTLAFARYARKRGLTTWQPRHIEEISWSFHLDDGSRRVEIVDRCANRSWKSGDLAGIWYQSMPPLATETELEERDRRYIEAEYNAATRVLWHEAACVVVGQPPSSTPREIFDFGLESRVHLRRLGLPTLTDHIGTLASLTAELKKVPADLVRISRTDGSTSAWLSQLIDRPEKSENNAEELMAATVTDGQPARVAVHIDDEVAVAEVDLDGSLRPVERDGDIEAISRHVREMTGTRMGVTFLGLESGEWRIARISLQIPYWLREIVEEWFFPRLFELFLSGNRTNVLAGSRL
jgi:hypothetical protein